MFKLRTMSGSPSELNIAMASMAEADRTRSSSGIAGGEAEEVVALFDQLRNPLLRYLLGFSLGVSDAEDIIQEAFLALFQHLERAKSRENLRAWLFRVAHNLALKKLQRSWRESRNISQSIAAEHSIVDPGPNPEDQLAASQKQKRILAALNGLPEQNRWCLYLRAEGLRYREIAEVLDMSLGSVSLSLARSLAHMARAAER
jgi:RNA polymerase sigma-70 factor (ECF subfamily)